MFPTEEDLPITIWSHSILNVGIQRSERRKWIHCFESLTSIIFCVDLSDYDQYSEETGENRMAESIALFGSVVNSQWFVRTTIILFLNKPDLLKIKLPKVPLERHFPDYTGGADVKEAAKYILRRLMQENRMKLNVYP